MSRRDELISAVTTAHRERAATGEVRSHPAWWDLDEDGRREAFEATARLRAIEAAIDPDGLSSTGHAVLARISRGR